MFSSCRECRVVGKVCAYSIILLHIDLTYYVACWSHCCNTSVAQLSSCASTHAILLPFQGVAPCLLAVGIFSQAGVAMFLLLRACVLRRVVWIAPGMVAPGVERFLISCMSSSQRDDIQVSALSVSAPIMRRFIGDETSSSCHI